MRTSSRRWGRRAGWCDRKSLGLASIERHHPVGILALALSRTKIAEIVATEAQGTRLPPMHLTALVIGNWEPGCVFDRAFTFSESQKDHPSSRRRNTPRLLRSRGSRFDVAFITTVSEPSSNSCVF